MRTSSRKFRLALLSSVLVLALTIPVAIATPASLQVPGDYIVAEFNADTLSRITPGGVRTVIHTLAGTGPAGVAIDDAGNYIVAEYNTDTLSHITPAGIRTVLSNFEAGTGPGGIAIDGDGNYIVAEWTDTLSRITPGGIRTVVFNFEADTAPADVAIDGDGNYIVAEFFTDTLSRITPGGVRTVVFNFEADTLPRAVAIDGDGNYIVTEFQTDTLSRITPGGVRTVLFNFEAGTGPAGFAIDDAGNYIVTEWWTETLSRITPGGVRTVVFNFEDGAGPHFVEIIPQPTPPTRTPTVTSTATPTSTPTVTPTAGPTYGGDFRYPIEEASTLDPVALGGSEWPIMGQVFEGLLKYDENLNTVAGIAASWETTDAQTWTFHLRDDVRFHNGRLVTAQDFVYSWNRAVGTVWWDFLMAPLVDSLAALNPGTFQVTLNQPFALLPSILAMPFLSVVPEEAVETIDSNPVGTGPFAFQHWTPGDEMVLVANEDYYEGRPHLDRITYRFYDDEGEMHSDFQAQNLELSPVPASEIPDVRDDPNAIFQNALWVYYYGMHVDMSPFDDVRVRQALNYAVDKGSVLSVVEGYREVANGFVPPGMQGYDPALPYYVYNPTQALSLLAQAGWSDTDDDDILDDGAGNDLVIELWHMTGADAAAFTVAVAEDLRDIGGTGVGATVTVSHTAREEYLDNLDQYPMFMLGWGADYADPFDFLDPHFRTGAEPNRTRYSNPQVDAWLGQVKATLAQSVRLALYATIEAQVQNDAPTINLYYPGSVYIKQPYVHGLELLYYPVATSMEKVWMDQWAPTSTPTPTPTPTPTHTQTPTVTPSYTPADTPTVTPTAMPCPDAYEPDDEWLHARSIVVGAPAQGHSFHPVGDVDFVKFPALAGETYTMRAFNLGGRPDNDTTLTLYDVNGTTPLAYNDEHPFEEPGASRIVWEAADAGTYFLKAAQFNPAMGGCELTYLLEVMQGSLTPTGTPTQSPTPTNTPTQTPTATLYRLYLPLILKKDYI
jgi:oligopeptide transport system substrate-binding protein